MCNNSQLKDGKVIGLPTEGALLHVGHMVSVHAHVLAIWYMHMMSTCTWWCHALLQLGLHNLRDQFVRTAEHSFSSEKKWMGVCVRNKTFHPSDVSYMHLLN